jgi:hypothetical protein
MMRSKTITNWVPGMWSWTALPALTSLKQQQQRLSERYTVLRHKYQSRKDARLLDAMHDDCLTTQAAADP